ncbi:hypothetical protein WHR41_03466 [Cladosporium halotolerans]|uniref:Uncharacterized protein n=1 Tax=Cladosporium halotolerans TaxID=1052096 RepID=A0AB34KWK3_9PEZI
MHAFIPFVALLGLAAAQSETTNSASGTSSATDPTSTCLAACAAGDVNCQAQCVNVPYPNESQINATLQCSTNECTQGDSGPEDTKKYGECLASCARDFYYTSGATVTGVVANAGATGSSSPSSNDNAGSTTGSGSSASATDDSSSSGTGSSDSSETASSTSSGSSDSSESSASSSADSASSTGAAASLSLSNEMITISGGVVGLVVAALAL